MRLERTPEQLDPLAMYALRPVVPLICAFVVGYAIIATIAHGGQIGNPMLAVVSVLVLAAAAAIFVVAAHPAFSPIRLGAHILIIGLAIVASGLFAASVWGTDRLIQDNWGQIAIGLLLAAMASFRPPGEILLSGGVAAAIVGAIAAGETPFLTISSSPILYITVAATPILAFSFAAAASTRVTTAAALSWRATTLRAIERLGPEVREGAAKMVHQEQVDLLSHEAAPFFTDLLQRDEITEADVSRAREIAVSLRRSAVATVEQSWLDEAIARAVAQSGASAQFPVSPLTDPDRLAEFMTTEQRGTVAAILMVLSRGLGFDAKTLSATIERAAGRCHFTLSAHLGEPGRVIKAELLPYLSVLRVVARDARLRVRSGDMALQFFYDQT
ncbi:MAG: hypothetical protein QOH55_1997 [Microbacteriaceae bacterium]|jgi:hypothetical protein|nr:hypothetical protein [Microbacteriaceae bacterium]